MPESELRLVRRLAEFRPKEEVQLLPHDIRGIYVLYKRGLTSRHKTRYNVVYVGMAARGGIRGRLLSHKRSKRKGTLWTHFSTLEVWDNIRNEEIVELEGLFRFVYRKDAKASALNTQRGFKKAKRIRENDLRKWH